MRSPLQIKLSKLRNIVKSAFSIRRHTRTHAKRRTVYMGLVGLTSISYDIFQNNSYNKNILFEHENDDDDEKHN